MKLPKSERHDFVAPLILPEIMKNAAEEYTAEKLDFYSPDYFTVKSVITGKIEPTDSTFTIHHFAARYHSDDWHNVRNIEQEIFTKHGYNLRSKIFILFWRLSYRIKHYGFFFTVRYYFDRFIIRKKVIRPYKYHDEDAE
jgi:hypothetical protein